MVLAKRKDPPIEQILTDPAGRCVFLIIKDTTDAVLALYAPSRLRKERRIDKEIFKRKIKKLFDKNVTQKNNLILLGDFNMTLGNKDRSKGNKVFCESQEN